LIDAQPELGDRQVGRWWPFVRRHRGRVLGARRVAEESTVEPERVEVIVEPAERLLEDVVQRGEVLAFEDRQPRADARGVEQVGRDDEHLIAGLRRDPSGLRRRDGERV